MKRYRSMFFMFIIVVLFDQLAPILAAHEFRGRAFRINPQPCLDRHGRQGTCMFQWECRRRNGLMLSTCLDRFLFGTCCQLPAPDSSLGEPDVDNNKLTPDSNKQTKVPQLQTTTRPLAITVNNFLQQSEDGGTGTSHFVFSDAEFSTPEPVFDKIKNKTTPAYSVPDIDKIFHQFLGSILANYSKTEAFVTEANLFDQQESSTTATDQIVDSFSKVVTIPTTSSTAAETLDLTSLTDSVTSFADITATPSLTEFVSEISDYEEYSYEDNQTISTLIYGTSEGATSNDVTVSWTISTSPSASELELGPNETLITYEPQSETQVTFDAVDEVSHSEEVLDGHLGVATTSTTSEPKTTNTEPPETTTEATTTTTTTIITTTTTANPIVDYKNEPDVEKLLLSFSSWTLWPPSALLSHLFDSIRGVFHTLLGKVMMGSKCWATACEPHLDPDHDPDQAPLTAADSADAFPLQSNEAYCGVRPLVPNGRIVGGTSSKFGEWPWQVLIKEATWLGLFVKNKCGGVLLNHRYVITAAHCQPSFLASLLVVLGENDLSQSNEDLKSTQRNVRRVIVHRKFNALTFDNDVALLELERSVEYRPHIVPICLPADNADFINKIAVVSGWGRTKYGGRLPTDLQYVDVPIIPNSKCQQMFLAAGHIKAIGNKFICAGYREGGKDSCEGDSGGPLVMKGDDDRYVLVGTVSHGIKCAYPNLPGVYIRITAYKSWIEKIINS